MSNQCYLLSEIRDLPKVEFHNKFKDIFDFTERRGRGTYSEYYTIK